MDSRLIIPTTEIRRLYEFLGKWSLKTRQAILEDFARKDSKKDLLVEMVNRSLKHFGDFSNVEEEFLRVDNKRMKLPDHVNRNDKKRTNHIVKLIGSLNCDSSNTCNIKYIEREIDPRRSTYSTYDYGGNASHSGTGGIDFIGWDETYNKPFIGEVKTPKDKEAFYALVQVLMYFVEISTPYQIERCNRYLLFKKELKPKQDFALGIILTDFHKRSTAYQSTLEKTKSLASYLSEHIEQIHNIQFLDFAEPYKEFVIL